MSGFDVIPQKSKRKQLLYTVTAGVESITEVRKISLPEASTPTMQCSLKTYCGTRLSYTRGDFCNEVGLSET